LFPKIYILEFLEIFSNFAFQQKIVRKFQFIKIKILYKSKLSSATEYCFETTKT